MLLLSRCQHATTVMIQKTQNACAVVVGTLVQAHQQTRATLIDAVGGKEMIKQHTGEKLNPPLLHTPIICFVQNRKCLRHFECVCSFTLWPSFHNNKVTWFSGLSWKREVFLTKPFFFTERRLSVNNIRVIETHRYFFDRFLNVFWGGYWV